MPGQQVRPAVLQPEALEELASQTDDYAIRAHLRTNGISDSVQELGLRVQNGTLRPKAVSLPSSSLQAESSHGASASNAAAAPAPADLRKIFVNPEVYSMIMAAADELDSLQDTLESTSKGDEVGAGKRPSKWGVFAQMHRLVRGKPRADETDVVDPEPDLPMLLPRKSIVRNSQLHVPEGVLVPSKRKAPGANWMQLLRPKQPPKELMKEPEPVEQAPVEVVPEPSGQVVEQAPVQTSPANQLQPPAQPVDYMDDRGPRLGRSAVQDRPEYEADKDDPLSLGGGRRKEIAAWEKYAKARPAAAPDLWPEEDTKPPAPERTGVVWNEAAIAEEQWSPKKSHVKRRQRSRAATDDSGCADIIQEPEEDASTSSSTGSSSEEDSDDGLQLQLHPQAEVKLQALELQEQPADEELMQQLCEEEDAREDADLKGPELEQKLERAARCDSASGHKFRRVRMQQADKPRQPTENRSFRERAHSARKAPPLPHQWRPAGTGKKKLTDVAYMSTPYQERADLLTSLRSGFDIQGSHDKNKQKSRDQRTWRPTTRAPVVDSTIRDFWSADKPVAGQMLDKSKDSDDKSYPRWQPAGAGVVGPHRYVPAAVPETSSPRTSPRREGRAASARSALNVAQGGAHSVSLSGWDRSAGGSVEESEAVESNSGTGTWQATGNGSCSAAHGQTTSRRSAITRPLSQRISQTSPHKVSQTEWTPYSPSRVIMLSPPTPPSTQRPAAKASGAGAGLPAVFQASGETAQQDGQEEPWAAGTGAMADATAGTTAATADGTTVDIDAPPQYLTSEYDHDGSEDDHDVEEVLLYLDGVDHSHQVGLPMRLVIQRQAGKIKAVIPELGHMEILLQEEGLLPTGDIEVVGHGAAQRLTTRKPTQTHVQGTQGRETDASGPCRLGSTYEQRVAHPRTMALLPRLAHPSVSAPQLPVDDVMLDTAHASVRSESVRPHPTRPTPQTSCASGHASPLHPRTQTQVRRRKGQDLVMLSSMLQNHHHCRSNPGLASSPAHDSHTPRDHSYSPSPPNYPAYAKSQPLPIGGAGANGSQAHDHSSPRRQSFTLGASGTKSPQHGAGTPEPPLSLPPVGLHGRLQMRANMEAATAAMRQVKPLGFVKSMANQELQYSSGPLPRLMDLVKPSRSLDWGHMGSDLQLDHSGKPSSLSASLDQGTGLLLPKLSLQDRKAAVYAAAEAAQAESQMELAEMAAMAIEMQQNKEEAARRRQQSWLRRPIAVAMMASPGQSLSHAGMLQQSSGDAYAHLPSSDMLDSPAPP